MKAVIAIDSFKGSLTSVRAGNAAAEGIKRIYNNAETYVVSVADGGEGTVDSLVEGMHGKKMCVMVTGPLGTPVNAEYGIIDGKTAVIEMSSAAGITLVADSERNPMYTTTYGVGEIIIDAVNKGCRDFIIGIGGSATNDGGIGMLQALGFDVLDVEGEKVPFGAVGLKELSRIDDKNAIPELSECTFNIACDVTNPLCGDDGCSAVFAPQKGADALMIEQMDKWLYKYAELAKSIRPSADMNTPGAGAAGGIGFAFQTFLNSRLKNGISLILDKTNIEKYIQDADVVITGEGRLDSQTVMGKVPYGVAKIAKRHGVPVVAFSGCVTDEAGVCNQHGIDAFFPILRTVCTLDEAMNAENAYKNIADTVEQVFRLMKISSVEKR